MNFKGGWALIRRTWLSWMQHRGFFFLLAFGWMIPPLIYLFVWSTAAGGETLGGLSQDQFVVYYLVLIVVNQVTYSQTNWTVGDLIRYGDMSTWLLRPLSPVFQALSTEIAGKVVYMVFTLPVALILALILRPQVVIAPENIPTFMMALGMAWALRFFWGYWLALLAFWATRADSLLALQDSLIFLVGGQVAPLALLPEELQIIARWLPFRYMVGFPVEVLTGQLDKVELAFGLTLQAAWLIVAILLYGLIWRAGVRRYAAVGG